MSAIQDPFFKFFNLDNGHQAVAFVGNYESEEPRLHIVIDLGLGHTATATSRITQDGEDADIPEEHFPLLAGTLRAGLTKLTDEMLSDVARPLQTHFDTIRKEILKVQQNFLDDAVNTVLKNDGLSLQAKMKDDFAPFAQVVSHEGKDVLIVAKGDTDLSQSSPVVEVIFDTGKVAVVPFLSEEDRLKALHEDVSLIISQAQALISFPQFSDPAPPRARMH